jgi:hypothetical protein
MLQVFARNRRAAKELLQRTDANWSKATVPPVELRSQGKSGLVIARMEIPFEREQVRMRISALFKRPVTSEDGDRLAAIVENRVRDETLDPSIEARIGAIRSDYEKVVTDPDLRFQLQATQQDFYVVELEDELARARGRAIH